MYFCYNYNYYKSFIRYHIISKHNTLNAFRLTPASLVSLIFTLKNTSRDCNLLLFWLIFVLTGRKPVILKVVSKYKKNKFKFVLTLKIKVFISVLRTFSVFVIPGYETKKKWQLRSDQGGFFCIFRGTCLEYYETSRFCNYLGNAELKLLIENLSLVFRFKSESLHALNTLLGSIQLASTTH